MRNEVKAILAKLVAVQDRVEWYLDNANDLDNYDEGRIDALENELEALSGAIAALEGIGLGHPRRGKAKSELEVAK